MKPRHKKFFYTAFAYVGMKDFNGANSFPIDLPVEFMSEGSCNDFITRNRLDAEWPDGFPVPEVVGACDPVCFCAIYRRQIAREWRRRPVFVTAQFALMPFRWVRLRLPNVLRGEDKAPIWAIVLLFAGYERMRRSVAEESILAKGGIVTDEVPEGHHVKAVTAFVGGFF